MGQRFSVGKIIYRDEFHIFIFISGPEHEPTDSSKAVNGDFYWHIDLLDWENY
jgi:hypothetical protein